MLNNPVLSGEPDKNFSEVVILEPGTGNPFPGLRPFTLDECHLFFGREGQVDEILLKLSRNRFVTVLGYSGSGKSSLMTCGLIPVLYGGFMTQTGPNWNVILTRPGSSPIDNLAEAIVDFLVDKKRVENDDRLIHKAIIQSVLRSGPEGLLEITRYLQSQKGENVFFLVDQFEEIFRNQDDGSEDARNDAHLYVNLMLTAVSQAQVPAYVALTMRSDFIGYCSVFPGLTHLINNSNYLVPQMTREQKKMAVEGPIAVAGGKISQRLIKRLLSDMGNNQDQLPILQHALMRTWDYWIANREQGEVIDLRHYNAIGRIAEALSQHANEAYDELNTRQKEIAEVLFKTITEKNTENRGMRRPGKLSLIAELAEASEQEVIDIVDQFRQTGRSFLMPGVNVALNGDSIVEISHESLMRIWTRLDTWVEEEFESAQMYKRLSEAAAMYQIGKTGLWRPPDLQLALNWQKKQKPTSEWAQRYDETFERAIVFLDTSRITYEAELKNQEMLQRRVLRRTRVTAVILGVAFVVAILFFVYANIQRMTAESETTRANNAAKEAEAQRKIAQDQKEIADVEKQRAIDARELADNYNKELKTTIQQLAQANDQTRQALLRAQAEEQKAIDAGEKEKEQRQIAEKKTVEAQVAYDSANRLFMLTKAQTLEGYAVREEDDPELSALLAMQGYHYHRRYNGKKYDPYIYLGLYSALTKLSGLSYNAIKSVGPPHVHIKSLVVSTKTNGFYTSGADGRILKGDIEKLRNTPTGYATPYPSKVIAVSPDENYLVNGSDSAFVQVYNLKEKRERPSLVVKGFKGSTNDIEFLSNGSAFIVSGSDKSLSSVSTSNWAVKPLLSLPYELKAISISPDGKTLAGGSWTGQLVLVDLEKNSFTTLVDDNTVRILSVKFSPDGGSLAFGVEEKINNGQGKQGAKIRGVVKIYNFQTKETRQLTGHLAGVTDVEFSPDGKLIASAGLDKRLIMWVLENQKDLPIVMENNNGFIWDISFTKNSDYLIAACSESEIRVWPTDQSLLAEQICPKITRNMTQDEWLSYVGAGSDLKYETTCIRGGLLK